MWFYVNGGQQYGPVDDAALDNLFRQGVVRSDTLVWKEGQPAWQPYTAVRGSGAPPPPAWMPPPAYGPPPAFAPPPVYAPPSAYGPGPVFDYAVWPTRVLGALVDYLFVLVAIALLYGIGFAVFGSVIGIGSGIGSEGLSNMGGLACCCMLGLTPAASLLVGLYNKVHLVSQRGFSIGQGIVKVKVVDANGQRLTFGMAFLRLLVQAGLSFIPIGALLDALWPLWDDRRQTLHDKAVNSYVINNPSGM